MRQAKPNWRLKKTISRPVDYRPIEQDDVKYAWISYKKGALADLGPKFADTSMNADEFKIAFQVEVTTAYHGAWTLLAQTPRGFMPVGFVLGFWSHPEPRYSVFMNVGAMVWLPIASKRNKIETAIYFFNSIRNDFPMVEYAREKDKRFFEVVARHGIMRRVGTSHNIYPGEPAAVYETRRP